MRQLGRQALEDRTMINNWWHVFTVADRERSGSTSEKFVEPQKAKKTPPSQTDDWFTNSLYTSKIRWDCHFVRKSLKRYGSIDGNNASSSETQ